MFKICVIEFYIWNYERVKYHNICIHPIIYILNLITRNMYHEMGIYLYLYFHFHVELSYFLNNLCTNIFNNEN